MAVQFQIEVSLYFAEPLKLRPAELSLKIIGGRLTLELQNLCPASVELTCQS